MLISLNSLALFRTHTEEKQKHELEFTPSYIYDPFNCTSCIFSSSFPSCVSHLKIYESPGQPSQRLCGARRELIHIILRDLTPFWLCTEGKSFHTRIEVLKWTEAGVSVCLLWRRAGPVNKPRRSTFGVALLDEQPACLTFVIMLS